MKKDKILKHICNSSRLPWEEAAAPKGAAAHSLGTTALNAISHVIALGIQTNSQIHSHYTRASHHYRSQFARVKIKKFSILCSGPTI